ncbi:MAG: rhomboid family intramembrane serine protease [Anaerolineae bacterium]|nr:rhomboid family intramembrane serine protease [Anaerolineae bacterium]
MFPLRDTVRARELPVVNWLLIAANVLVFLFEASLRTRHLEVFTRVFGLVPARFLAHPGPDQLLTVFTSMFLHGGWWHLISNMWALYIFGDNVEDRMGHGRYLIFYLLGGAGAAAAHILVSPDSTVPTIGASGAISAVMGAYLVLFTGARVVTLVPGFFLPWFVEVPALLFIGSWFVSQLFNGLFALGMAGLIDTYGGVAWWAHVGGFVSGLLLVKVFERRYYRRPFPDEYWPW